MSGAPDEFFTVGVAVDPYEGWDFRQTKNGHLHCLECGTDVWCKHIEHAVKEHADSEAIWVEPRWEQIQGLQIPMFPTANLWAQVNLDLHLKTGAYKVITQVPTSMVVGTSAGAALIMQDVFLGFLHESEGRMIIRSMILDWFIGTVDQSKLKCTSASHKPKQEFQWQQALKKPETAVVARWAVWTTNSCTACLLPDDWDDLIPQDSGNRRSPFNG